LCRTASFNATPLDSAARNGVSLQRLFERSKTVVKRFCILILLMGLSLVLALPSTANPRPLPGARPETDPTLLWNTFMGGADWDQGWAVAIDGSRNVYVAGKSDSTWGSPLRPYGGAGDAFVAKLNSKGELVWNTFLGSATGEDQAYAIALDGSGNVNVTGESLFSWGSPIHAHSGQNADIFVAQLGSNGALKWNTFHGGQSIDRGYGLAADGSGNIYVSGLSHGTWGLPVNPPGTGLINEEAFAARFSRNGALQWNTFMGDRNGADRAKAVAVNGAVVVTGHSANAWGTPVRPHSGDWYGDAFVAQLNAQTGARQWNTFLGGAGTDEGEGIACRSGNVYVSGYSDATWGNPVAPFPGKSENAFVSRLGGNGGLQWNTFMGGGDYEDDRANGIAVGPGGRIFVAGESDDTWGNPVQPHGNDIDAFVAELSTNGARQWNTFLGGDSGDRGHGIVADEANVWVAGLSWVEYGDWGTPVRPGSGKDDAWAVRLGVEPVTMQHLFVPLVLRKD
jgi:hypothetical protein